MIVNLFCDLNRFSASIQSEIRNKLIPIVNINVEGFGSNNTSSIDCQNKYVITKA